MNVKKAVSGGGPDPHPQNYPIFSTTVSGINTPLYATAPCHIARIFRPLPGSRHFKLKKAWFCLQSAMLFLAWGTLVHPV